VPVLSLACLYPYGLAAGTELTNHQATVSIWYITPSFAMDNIDTSRDARSLGEPVVHYVESHSDDVTEVSVGKNLRSIPAD
jgi:hypothetical protein